MKRVLFKTLCAFSFIGILWGCSPLRAYGHLLIDENVVEGLRRLVARTYQDEATKHQHAPELVPIARSLVEYVNSLPEENINKQKLRGEVLNAIEQSTVSEDWLTRKIFEVAHEKGASSGEAAELFEYALNIDNRDPRIASVLSLFLNMQELVDEANYVRGLTYRPIFAKREMRAKVEKELRQRLPISVTYPIPGNAKFEIPFLIKAYLQHIYPLAFSDGPVSAHGIRMSPEWFATHDAFHRHEDTRFLAIVNHVMRMMDQYVKKGVSEEAFLEAYIPYAVRSYNRMMESLLRLFEGIQNINCEEEQRRAFAGYILMLHEYMPYTIGEFKGDLDEFSDVFTQGNFEILVSHFTNSVKADLSHYKSWESPEDPLETSPLTGESPASDEEIIRQAKERLQYYKILIAQDEGQRQKVIEEDMASQTIKRSRRFIIVRTTWKDGIKEPMAVYPTLAHKWDNMDDSLALLEYAGISIKKPDLPSIENPEEQYKVAQEVLGQVQIELQKLMDSFKSTSERIIQQTGLGDNFMQDFRAQEQEMTEQLEKFLAGEQELSTAAIVGA